MRLGDEAARSAQNFSLFLSLFIYIINVYVFKRSLSLSELLLKEIPLSLCRRKEKVLKKSVPTGSMKEYKARV